MRKPFCNSMTVVYVLEYSMVAVIVRHLAYSAGNASFIHSFIHMYMTMAMAAFAFMCMHILCHELNNEVHKSFPAPNPMVQNLSRLLDFAKSPNVQSASTFGNRCHTQLRARWFDGNRGG